MVADARTYTRSLARRRRALYISSPIGLGHAQRDVAIADELRKLHPDLKVIFVSGYAEDAFRKNLPEGEEFNFLAKPFSLKQLVAAVKQAVAE